MYRNDRFEWDEVKNRANRGKHGLGFDDVLGAFDDPHALEIPDDEHGEERWILIARITGTDLVVTIAHTERGERDRIISARPATKAEERTYYSRRA